MVVVVVVVVIVVVEHIKLNEKKVTFKQQIQQYM